MFDPNLSALPMAIAFAADTGNNIEFSDSMYVISLGFVVMKLQNAWAETLATDREAVLAESLRGNPAKLSEAQEKYNQDTELKDTILQGEQTTIQNEKQRISEDSDEMTNVYGLEGPLNGYVNLIKNLIAAGFK